MTDSADVVGLYRQELKELASLLLRMGRLVETQLAAAVQSVRRHDDQGAQSVIKADREVDGLHVEVEAKCHRLLSVRATSETDMRAVVAPFKMAHDLERIGDLAANIAKRAIVLNYGRLLGAEPGVELMGAMVGRMVKDVLDAYAAEQSGPAIDVWHRDVEVDRLYNSVFRELLTYMMEDPRNVTPGTHLMFVAKNLERIGDLATNMAEDVVYLIEGRQLDETRKKEDVTSSLAGPFAAGPAPD
jgi:phosphate transport system protein